MKYLSGIDKNIHFNNSIFKILSTIIQDNKTKKMLH